MDNTVLTINHLSKRYPVGKNQYFRKAKHYVRAVDDVSLTIKKGEILGLVGESGCGKTTIAKIMGQSLFLWDWIKLSKYRESRTSEDLKMIA